MNTPFTYDFGYMWQLTWGPAIPLAAFGGLALAAYFLGWKRWITVASGALAAWCFMMLVFVHLVFRVNLPMDLPTEQFLSSGGGEVVDVGAGSGRFSTGLLLARPNARVTAIDIYDGFWGIDNNTPQRFMRNASIAGVASRAQALVGDARAIPLADAAYDGVISSYAIDHLRREEIPTALSEVKRILKPGGEFLLAVVHIDWWMMLVSPVLAHHPSADPQRWHRMLTDAGFDIRAQGTSPATLHFLAVKGR
jgi:SAM-dependent methyltransferase